MRVYVINLDRHPDRLAHMRDQLSEVGFERVAAVDGIKTPPTNKHLTRFESACLESHRDAWRLFLKGPDTHACFLEDDVHLWPDFGKLAKEESWIPADAHSVKLDTYLQEVKLGERRTICRGRQLARLYTRHESSAAYVLSRAGAERYMELTAQPIFPTDYSLFPKNPRRLGLRIYQLAPAVAVQDHLLQREEGGQTIQTAMANDASAKSHRPSAGKLWRECLRLAGQALDAKESIYLSAFIRPEKTTVGFG